MDDQDQDRKVQEQLEHMVQFIYREADEKGSEIQRKAQEEFATEKSRIVTEEKLKIIKEFERKEKQVEVKKKIVYSNELNQARLRALKARDEATQGILAETHKRLIELTREPTSYKVLLKGLVLQGLSKLEEDKVTVVVRLQDRKLVEQVIPDAVAEFTVKTGRNVELSIDNTLFLPPGPPERPKIEGEVCSGGVILSANNGKIVCSNTLDARLAMAWEQQQPFVRITLFGRSATRIHFD